MIHFLYQIFAIPALYLASQVGRLFNPKIKQGWDGRRKLFHTLAIEMAANKGKSPRFWIHNSSMGEFEQAKPLITEIKKRYPESMVIVSFFSPSGLENVTSNFGADVLCYLPFDRYLYAKRFFDLIRPDMGIIIRHDFWPNHFLELKRRNIPLILVNASIRKRAFYRLPGVLFIHRWLYQSFTSVLTVSPETAELYQHYRLGKAPVDSVGDTRYDQVVARAKAAEALIQNLRPLKKDRLCFVMGSTWPSDEDVLIDALERMHRENHKLPWCIFVPHEPHEEHLSILEYKLSKFNLKVHRLSKVENQSVKENDMLIIDRIGILASLYGLSDLAFVGGGFGPGVHNVLEPAAFGQAVLYGPRCKNSFEAGELESEGIGHVIENSEAVYHLLMNLYDDPSCMKQLGHQASVWVNQNVGATKRIVDRLEQYLS